MKENWTVETIGNGLYIAVFNFTGSNLVYMARYSIEAFSTKEGNVVPPIGRWMPKTIKQ